MRHKFDEISHGLVNMAFALLRLDPENKTAKEKIGRADKVLNSLEDLQRSQLKPESKK